MKIQKPEAIKPDTRNMNLDINIIIIKKIMIRKVCAPTIIT